MIYIGMYLLLAGAITGMTMALCKADKETRE